MSYGIDFAYMYGLLKPVIPDVALGFGMALFT
jgi:hypothetical protein